MAAPLRLLLRRAGPLALLLVLLQYCPLAVDSMEDGLARKPPRGFRTWNCFVRKTHLCLSCLLTRQQRPIAAATTDGDDAG